MTIKGMDISYWQGNVDFARVAADGIKFAILREGYAQTVDAKFRQYVEGCRKNGIEIKGVYHFSYAINAEQAAQEAAFCIKQMEQAGLGKDVIVFYDFEYDTVKKAKAKGVTLGKNECIAFTKAFCEYVESPADSQVHFHSLRLRRWKSLYYFQELTDVELRLS